MFEPVSSQSSPADRFFSYAPGKCRALVSVSDKSALGALGRRLEHLGFLLVSTGSTAAALQQAGVKVDQISSVTGFPEILDGRVKTLHPAVFGGILARPQLAPDSQVLSEQAILPIPVVVCNLYPFAAAAAAWRKGQDLSMLIENIDIGGVTLLRAAAKNHENVLVLCDPADYDSALDLLEAGKLGLNDLRRYAVKALKVTAAYDKLISETLESAFEPSAAALPQAASPESTSLALSLHRVSSMRYGENPHQKAGLFRFAPEAPGALDLTRLKQLAGKELSYNNYLDVEHGLRLLAELPPGACAILKHNMPCGVGLAPAHSKESQSAAAFGRAFETDPISPFGGVVMLNVVVDRAGAERMAEVFLEIISAPGFTAEALEILMRKKNLRLIELDPAVGQLSKVQYTQIQGGFLVQDYDALEDWGSGSQVWQSKTSVPLPPGCQRAIHFAWTVAKSVRSNAIVFAAADENNLQTFAIAGGFTNRVDAVKRCLELYDLNVRERLGRGPGFPPEFVVASDGFFPFADSIANLAKYPVRAVVQPGGSVRDEEVLLRCQELGYPVILTGVRHFKH